MKEIPATFQSILFATRGLDLAIPSRKAFLNLTAHGSDFALDVEKDGVPYTECPRSFMAAKETEDDTFEISCFGMNLAMQESERRRIDDGNNTDECNLISKLVVWFDRFDPIWSKIKARCRLVKDPF